MRLGVLLSVMLTAVFVLSGCDSSKVSEQDIAKQKETIAKLEKDLQAAKEEKQNAVASASEESREKAEEKIAELEAKLQEERDKLSAMEERHQFENQMVQNLEDMEEQIDRLEEHADKATGDRKVQLRKKVAALKTQHEQLSQKLTELRAASGDNWASIKTETEQAWNEASTSLEDAMKDVKEGVEEISSPDTTEGDTPTKEGATKDDS